MNFPDYVAKIEFRFIKPQTACVPTGLLNLTPLVRFGTLIESFNTTLPRGERNVKADIYRLSGIPRMSTFAIGAIIHEAVAQMPDEDVFLNVGVWHGFTLLSGMIGNKTNRCIGVDNFSQFGGPKAEFIHRFKKFNSGLHRFYEMDFEYYLRNVHSGKIGFYIYDANHERSEQIRGLKLAEPFLARNCIVLIDDANSPDVKRVVDEFISSSCHRYQMILSGETRTQHHPTFWNGITILKKMD